MEEEGRRKEGASNQKKEKKIEVAKNNIDPN